MDDFPRRPLAEILDELTELAGAHPELEAYFGTRRDDPDRQPFPMSPECRRLLALLEEIEVDPAAYVLAYQASPGAAKRLTADDLLARLPPEVREAPPLPPPPPLPPEELGGRVERAVAEALQAHDRRKGPPRNKG